MMPTMHDPFDLLGIPPRFPPSLDAIDHAWLAASARLHPDRAQDPVQAARELARINSARQTLSSFEGAANALLARLGGPAPEQDKSLPDGLLEAMLEARDRLDEARGDVHALAGLDAWARERRDAHLTHVTELFALANQAPADGLLHDIRMQLNAWRYIERFIEQLNSER